MDREAVTLLRPLRRSADLGHRAITEKLQLGLQLGRRYAGTDVEVEWTRKNLCRFRPAFAVELHPHRLAEIDAVAADHQRTEDHQPEQYPPPDSRFFCRCLAFASATSARFLFFRCHECFYSTLLSARFGTGRPCGARIIAYLRRQAKELYRKNVSLPPLKVLPSFDDNLVIMD